MLFLIGSGLIAGIVTTAAAWWLTHYRPALPAGSQTVRASFVFPTLACLLFACAVVFTLLSGQDGNAASRQATGMVIFSFVFFLIYAVVIGFLVGVPTAIVAVRAFRNGG